MQVLRLVGVVVRVRNGGARTGCRGAGVSGCRRPGCQVGPGGGWLVRLGWFWLTGWVRKTEG
jgi:hypothetical protein